MVSTNFHNFLKSFGNAPSLLKQGREPLVEIHRVEVRKVG